MAGPFYVDPAAGGLGDGSSWINAWTSIQTAFDTAVAGEIVYCRGTQTFADATTIDVDTQSGTNAAGWIRFIGCNAAGNRDGTRFVIDVNSQACNGLTFNGTADMVWLENFEIKNAGAGGDSKSGIVSITASSVGCVFINVSVHNCSGIGINGAQFTTQNFFFRCVSYLNTLDGFAYGGGLFFACCARDNGRDGFASIGDSLGCLAYDNGDDGFSDVSPQAHMLNDVSNGNADDGVVLATSTSTYGLLFIGCRTTNHSGAGDIGLNANSEPCLTLSCYFEDNDGDNIQNATVHQNISIDGTATSSNIEDQANTNEGYTDKTDDAQDFNLRSDASLRRTAITIPVS